MADTKPPKVFISYAWEDDTRIWTRQLAKRLRSDGIDVLLDQWDVAPGDSLPEFMENSVSVSDFVLIVCTPAYKKKSDSSNPSGVGYEKGVITGELFVKRNQRKFIPILRKGYWLASAPAWVLGKDYIDLRGIVFREANYRELLRTIYGRRVLPPPIGKPPEFPDGDDDLGEPKSSANFFTKIKGNLSEFFDNAKSFLPKSIPAFRIVGIIGAVIALFWFGSLAIPKFVSLIPTPKATSTKIPIAQITSTSSPIPPTKTLTATETPPPSSTPTESFTSTPSNLPQVYDPHPAADDYHDSLGVPMRLVPAGEFTMGDNNGQPDEKPASQV